MVKGLMRIHLTRKCGYFHDTYFKISGIITITLLPEIAWTMRLLKDFYELHIIFETFMLIIFTETNITRKD